jgi:hypothetical protein
MPALTPPPAAKRNTQTTFREAEQQTRAFEGGRVVRVVGETGNFIQRLDPARDADAIRRLLAAPNAVPVRKHGGELVGIRLLSLGDDRGCAGERHGRSTVTTERVRNDHGVYIGGDRNLKHKGRLGLVPVCGEGTTCAATPTPPSN